MAPWPAAAGEFDADVDALERVQTAVAIVRRSGVRVRLESDALRIFEAVERRAPAEGDGNAAAEIERLRKEIARGEGMLGNDKFVQNAAPDVVEAERSKLECNRRELDALER